MGDEGEPIYGNLGRAEGGGPGAHDHAGVGQQQTPTVPLRGTGHRAPTSPDAPMVPDRDTLLYERDSLLRQRDEALDEARRLKHFLRAETEARLMADADLANKVVLNEDLKKQVADLTHDLNAARRLQQAQQPPAAGPNAPLNPQAGAAGGAIANNQQAAPGGGAAGLQPGTAWGGAPPGNLPDPDPTTRLCNTLAAVLPRSRDANSINSVPVLTLDRHGINVDDWLAVVERECSYQQMHGGMTWISYALGFVDKQIGAQFKVTRLSNWTWEGFKGLLKCVVPQKLGPGSVDVLYLPRVQNLKRTGHMTFNQFTFSADFLSAYDELMLFDENSTTDHHRATVILALTRCFPSGSTKKFRKDSGELDLDAMRRFSLVQIVKHTLQWVREHLPQDETFRKDLLASTGETREVGGVEARPAGNKHCDNHGWCRHTTEECRGWVKRDQGQRGGRGGNQGGRGGSQPGRGRGRGGRGAPHQRGGRGGRGGTAGASRGEEQGQTEERRKAKKPKKCFICDSTEHLVLQCPSRPNPPAKNGKGLGDKTPA